MGDDLDINMYDKSSSVSSEETRTVSSGASTPYRRSQLSSGHRNSFGRARRNSQETIISSAPTSMDSEPSIIYPRVPVNSPLTQSLAGDVAALDTERISERLRQVSGQMTPPPHSVHGDDRGKKKKQQQPGPKARPLLGPLAVYRRKHDCRDTPMLEALFKDPNSPVVRIMVQRNEELIRKFEAAAAARDAVTPTPRERTESRHFGEHSKWSRFAEEDVELALKRLAVLARDEYQEDDSKSVQQYYSERLSALLKKAEIPYDVGTFR